jgi:predicted nucleic acid-binding Zn ribbon protein
MGRETENPLEDVLKNIISGITKKGGLTEEDVAAAWDSAVGEKAARHSKPRSLKGSRLIVNVDGSSWLYELTVRKKEILGKLAEGLNSKKIKEITLRIGELK